MSARILMTLAALTAATPAFAQGGQHFQGAGQRTQLDCDGGTIHIEGASNILTIDGACTALTLEGASNEIRVNMAAGGRITVTGASNVITWTAPAGAKVSVRSTGAANRIARGR